MMIVTAFTTSCWSWPEVMKPSQTLTFHFEAQKRSGRNFRRRRSYSDFSLQLSPLIVSTIWSFLISLGIVFWWKIGGRKKFSLFKKLWFFLFLVQWWRRKKMLPLKFRRVFFLALRRMESDQSKRSRVRIPAGHHGGIFFVYVCFQDDEQLFWKLRLSTKGNL